MKKLIIAAILLLTVTGTTFAAISSHPGDIPIFKGMDNFLKRFPQATEVNCKVKGQLTEVNFIWNGLQLQAFYDAAGNPVATCRPVTANNLPLFVQISLQNEYPNYVVRESAEFTDADDQLSYYVTVSGPKASYLLHVSTSGTISVFKKMKN